MKAEARGYDLARELVIQATTEGDTRLVPAKDWPKGRCPTACGDGWIRQDAEEADCGWIFANPGEPA
jgi:hypothetical protein